MKIALIGYGRMGREIEKIALERGHEIILKIDHENLGEFTKENLSSVNVAIEFTNPDSAEENVIKCLDAGVRVVSGTTGWNDKIPAAQEFCKKKNLAMIHASNFSPGVNMLFAINRKLASLMNNFDMYNVSITEIHHTRKLDAPSGTAITLAEDITTTLERKKEWVKGDEGNNDQVAIESIREGDVPGTHHVQYTSHVDDITISHQAHNRSGFALGAVLAAEYISSRTGIFSMRDILQIND